MAAGIPKQGARLPSVGPYLKNPHVPLTYQIKRALVRFGPATARQLSTLLSLDGSARTIRGDILASLDGLRKRGAVTREKIAPPKDAPSKNLVNFYTVSPDDPVASGKVRFCACGTEISTLPKAQKTCSTCMLKKTHADPAVVSKFHPKQRESLIKEIRLLHDMNPKRWPVDILAARYGLPLDQVMVLLAADAASPGPATGSAYHHRATGARV